MYTSLKATGMAFHLYIFAFDDLCFKILTDLKLTQATIIPLSDLENESLLSVKSSRTNGEYCWTCTPASIEFCLLTYNLPSCTYLDADLYFFNDPSPLLKEMGNASILLTEHRYTPCYDHAKVSGRFCVQFMTFVNDVYGMRALAWWREQCLAWCYARVEPNRFGDQKYLDDWCERFEKVHVLKHLGGGLAPWNIQQYKIYQEIDVLKGKINQQEVDIIFYHFHQLKFMKDGYLDLGGYRLRPSVTKYIYKPYIRKLNEIEARLGVYLDPESLHGKLANMPSLLSKVRRKWLGCYNIFSKKVLLHG